jgi:hypothetical protein
MGFWDIAKAIATGIVSIPADLYYGGRRTAEDLGLMGEATRLENAAERERLLQLLNDAFRNRQILGRLVTIILDEFFEKVPDDKLRRMSEKAGLRAAQWGGRYAAQQFLVAYITRKLVEAAIIRAAAQRIAKFGIGLIVSGVLLQGLLERASNAANRLRVSYPIVYQKIRNENLDMLYFIVEDFVVPYLEAAKLATQNSAEFGRVLDEIERQIGN